MNLERGRRWTYPAHPTHAGCAPYELPTQLARRVILLRFATHPKSQLGAGASTRWWDGSPEIPGVGPPVLRSRPSESVWVDGLALDPATLRRTAAVVRNRRDVRDSRDLDAERVQCANGRLTAGAGTLDAHF